MGVDQQYLKSQSGDDEHSGKNARSSVGADDKKYTGNENKKDEEPQNETYNVEHFKSLGDQKNKLKDEGMRERNTE